MTSETGCLRVYGPTRWISSRGRSTGIPFVARRGCGRGDSFGRPAGATAIEHGHPFGDNRTQIARSQTGPKHPAFPSRSGEGTPKRFGPPGETSSEIWAARCARQRRNESIQRPREHRAVARRQRRTNATDSSVEESPEVESSAAHRGDTEASAVPTARGNASRCTRPRPKGRGVVTAWSKAAEEGNASKGPRHRGRFLDGPSGPRPSGRRLGCEAESGSPKRGEPHGRLRGATNPRTVERVDLRICSLRSKPLEPGGTAGAEHDRDVAVPIRSPGDGLGG